MIMMIIIMPSKGECVFYGGQPFDVISYLLNTFSHDKYWTTVESLNLSTE